VNLKSATDADYVHILYDDDGINYNGKTIPVFKGDNVTLDYDDYFTEKNVNQISDDWNSSNPSVASIDESGNITAVGIGITTIQVIVNFKYNVCADMDCQDYQCYQPDLDDPDNCLSYDWPGEETASCTIEVKAPASPLNNIDLEATGVVESNGTKTLDMDAGSSANFIIKLIPSNGDIHDTHWNSAGFQTWLDEFNKTLGEISIRPLQ
jgi:uncharacterized protein YjdB